MAALRQLLNARGGYQISGSAPQVPDKTDQDRARASKAGDLSSKAAHSKYNESDSSGWQHPALRKDQTPERLQDNYARSNSLDEYGSSRPQHLLRTQTDSVMNRTDDNAFSMDVSSIYEDNESPALSPALNKHLALRPLNTQTSAPHISEDTSKPAKQRRRSRSVTEDSNGYYGSDPWESYRKDPSSKPKRNESLQVTSKSSSDSNSLQHLHDRQRSPTPLHNVRALDFPLGQDLD